MSKKHKGQTITVKARNGGECAYPVVSTFKVLHDGWESDNTGYVVMKGDKHAVVLTSHGVPYLASQKELSDHIGETEASLTGLRHAYALAFLP